MNELEKKSFYSFLGLYIFSSFFFVFIIGYLYFTAQKNALENETYYRLEHITDEIAANIIVAHMQGKELQKTAIPDDIVVALVDTTGTIVSGKVMVDTIPKKVGYFSKNGYELFVSDAPQKHLNIQYVIAQSNGLKEKIKTLSMQVLGAMVFISILLVLIAWILSKLFMKPLRQRVIQIEHFINDVTHELNTPITSLFMSSNQAIKKGECSPKTLKNISISTKQLYDIYRSLTYLNFSENDEIVEALNFKDVLEKSIEYYQPLADIKHISFDIALENANVVLPEAQATLLVGNLLGNAIKYSSPKSTITIRLKDNVLSIKDEGIGIEEDKQKEIFEKFKRGTEYSGGFGVGLSIVKSICDTYNIDISVNSALGEGTEFTLYFP